MTQDRVKALIGTYGHMVGRKATLVTHIAELEMRLRNVHDDLVDALASPKAQVISDMPHGSGKQESAVERIAIRLADGKPLDEYETELENEIARYKRELEQTEKEVAYVDGWLSALNERERYVLLNQMGLQTKWSDIEADYAKKFGYLSTKTLRRLRKLALQKVYAMACDI